MSTILGTAVIAVTGTLCCLILKKTNGELSFLLSVGALALIITAAFGKFEQLLDWIEQIAELNFPGEILNVLLKVLGIAVTADIAARHCRDCGENGLAAGLDLAAKTMILLTVLPLIDNILQVIEEVLSL